MEEARDVLARLDRIDALERTGAGPARLLPELRLLVREAERWARREGDPAALAAAGRCRAALGEAAGRGQPSTSAKTYATRTTGG